MKAKHLFMALALPTVFVACQDQNFVSTPQEAVDGQFVKLEKGFFLTGSTEGDAQTRGQWASTTGGVKFLWRPAEIVDTYISGGTPVTDYTYSPDQIGLAWTGVCKDADGNVTPGSAVTAVDERVYTNYKFTHFAWKLNGKEPQVDGCTGEFKSATIEPITNYANAYGYNAEGEKYYAKSGHTQVTNWPVYSTTTGDPNASEGLFETSNSTVYAGQYIVYSPYDPKNTSNYIVATSAEEFQISQFQSEANRAKTLEEFTNEIFKYGKTTIDNGGDKTTKFATENLNGYVGIKLKAKSGMTPTIKKVILYDATSSNLLTQVGLSAKGIMDGQSGKDLYLDNSKVAKKYAETVTAVINGGTGEALVSNAFKFITIPVLPTEQAISSLKVILVNDQNLAVETTLSNITVPRNAYATGNWIEIKDIDFTNASYLATDEASLKAAITALDIAANVDKNVSVRVLGNVTLRSTWNLTVSNLGRGSLTINGGKIIVPDTNSSAITWTINSKVVVNSNIDVMYSCCKNQGGVLNLAGGKLGGTINVGEAAGVEVDANHQAKLNVQGNKTSQLTGTINNYGNATLVAGNTTTATELDVKGGTINNYNALTIQKTSSAQGTGHLDAKLFVETGALNNKEGGEATIEGVLAVGNSATASNNGTVVDKISSQVTGNIYDLGVAPGKYISEVDNPDARFNSALYNRPTTTVRFVNTVAQTYNMSKLNSSSLRSSIDTYEVAASAATTFVMSGTTSSRTATMANLIVKSALNVKPDYSYTVYNSDGTSYSATGYFTLAVTNDLNVENGGSLTVLTSPNNTKTILNVNNLTVKAGGNAAIGKKVKSELVNLTTNAAISGGPSKGTITFDFNSQTFVSGLINIKGSADILQATGSGNDVAGDVWYTGSTIPQGDANWIHGIPTPWR